MKTAKHQCFIERVLLQKKVKAVIFDDDIKKQIEHKIAQIEEEIDKEIVILKKAQPKINTKCGCNRLELSNVLKTEPLK